MSGIIQAAAESVARIAASRGYLLATAESCTGGRVAAALTAIDGSSAYFAGGIVAYANRIKSELLGVDTEALTAFGAVSEPVVRAMAEGARDRLRVDAAVATTGIAGPSGGSEQKPVGTVWFGVATRRGTMVHCCRFDGARNAVQQQATGQALALLASELESL